MLSWWIHHHHTTVNHRNFDLPSIAAIHAAYQSIVRLDGTDTHLSIIACLISALAHCILAISSATTIMYYILESKESISPTISSTYFLVDGL